MMEPMHPGAMPERQRQGPVDYDTLAEYLSALGYGTRLELLDRLRFPHTLSEIVVSPSRQEGGRSVDRPAARQTVRGHLDKLVDADLVRVETVEQGGKRVNSYAVNPQKLYGLTEELRRLSTMYAGTGRGGDATGTLATNAPRERVTGPRLVLVHGVYEGKAFPLTPATRQDGRWLVGRRPGLPVSLDYDPYVSVENTALHERGGQFVVADLAGSKNGTSVNWAPLPRGGERVLESGDVIGAGRSLLLFLAR